MSRSSLVLGCCLLAVAVPARGQGLLEAIGDAIDASMQDSGDFDGGHDQGQHYHPDNGFHPHPQPHPHHPNVHYDKVWVGDHWEYIPHSNNVVYPNNNVVYPGTTVVGPSTTAITTAAVTPNALPYKGPGVTIALEEDVGGSVNYMIDGRESATIQAGQQQTLSSKGKYEVRFSRGKSEDGRNFGEARYTITEGNYHFTVTDKGWELLRDKEQPNLVTTQVQTTSPSGIKTNALPPKTAPAAAAQPAAPAAAPAAPAAAAPVPAAAPAANTVPAANAIPAANTVPAAPTPAAG